MRVPRTASFTCGVGHRVWVGTAFTPRGLWWVADRKTYPPLEQRRLIGCARQSRRCAQHGPAGALRARSHLPVRSRPQHTLRTHGTSPASRRGSPQLTDPKRSRIAVCQSALADCPVNDVMGDECASYPFSALLPSYGCVSLSRMLRRSGDLRGRPLSRSGPVGGASPLACSGCPYMSPPSRSSSRAGSCRSAWQVQCPASSLHRHVNARPAPANSHVHRRTLHRRLCGRSPAPCRSGAPLRPIARYAHRCRGFAFQRVTTSLRQSDHWVRNGCICRSRRR